VGSKLIAYNRDIAECLNNDIASAIFINQLLFWWRKGSNPNEIWKTDEEFYRETGLTRKQCIRCRQILTKKGWIKVVRKGLPARNYYILNLRKIAEDLHNFFGTVVPKGNNKICPKVTTSCSQR